MWEESRSRPSFPRRDLLADGSTPMRKSTILFTQLDQLLICAVQSFNSKEHLAIVIMSSSASGAAYATEVLSAQKLYCKSTWALQGPQKQGL